MVRLSRHGGPEGAQFAWSQALRALTWCALCCGLCFVCPRRALAQAAPSLVWVDDSVCSAPDRPDKRLAEMLGDVLTKVPPLRFDAHVSSPQPGRYRLDLRTLDGQAERTRTVYLESCDEARETSLLLAAVALDPNTPPSRERVDEDSDPPADANSQGSEPTPLRFGVGAHGGIDLLSLPGTAPLGAVSFALQAGAIRSYLQARYLAANTEDQLPDNVRVGFALLSGALGGCLVRTRGELTFGACAELELGQLRARARGLTNPRAQASVWAAATAGGVLEYGLKRGFSLGLSLRAGAALRRPRFAVVDAAPFHEVPTGVLRVTFGASWWFPTTEPVKAGH